MWFFITIFAAFLNAVAMVVDKTLLKKDIEDPIVYTFYIALLGAFVVLFFLPFGFIVPSFFLIVVSLVAGGVFSWGLILMFKALKKDDASRVTPMIGGLVPVFVLLLAWYLLEEQLNNDQYVGVGLLIVGTLLISLDFQERGIFSWLKKKFGLAGKMNLPHLRKTIWLALPSAALFAVYHVLSKYVYGSVNFVPGFIWTRIGAFLAILLLLMAKKNRQAIIQSFLKTKQDSSGKKTRSRFLLGQACGGASAFLAQYATALGAVSLVNALQGVQYVFIFILVVLMTKFSPQLLHEKLTREIVWQKIIAILLICAGLYFLVL